ncbi:MAG: hypothetical protein AABX16_04590 [Nanoarchaeota archaeon]
MDFNSISVFFSSIIDTIPQDQKIFVTLVTYTGLIALYCLFIWKYYTVLSNREIIKLNLKEYNRSKHPVIEKIVALFLYILEYLVILPFLVIFWFTILSAFAIVLSKSQDARQILLIAAAIITSTRIMAYIDEQLAEDVAKVLPLTLIAIFILESKLIDYRSVILKLYSLPTLIDNIFIFLVFIFAVEFFLRTLYAVIQFARSYDED